MTEVIIVSCLIHILILGSIGSGSNDFRGTKHDRAHGFKNSYAYAIVDSMPTCSGN